MVKNFVEKAKGMQLIENEPLMVDLTTFRCPNCGFCCSDELTEDEINDPGLDLSTFDKATLDVFRSRMSFFLWLAHKRWGADPMGDFARDVEQDDKWPVHAIFWQDIKTYMENCCNGQIACYESRRAARRAWSEYEMFVGGPSQFANGGHICGEDKALKYYRDPPPPPEQIDFRNALRFSVKFDTYCVYAHLTYAGEVFYVGMGAGDRPYNCTSRNEVWKQIVDEYRGFDVCILAWFGNKTDALAFEEKQIKKLRPRANFSHLDRKVADALGDYFV